jgi:thiamine-phosphate diphosphorylase
MPANLVQMLRLMLVTDEALLAGRDPGAVARAAAQGGVTCVQLRMKGASPRALAEAARALVAASPVPVLINDRPDVALAVGAAGVHLGEGDLDVARVRMLAPAGFVIGASVGHAAEAGRGAGADYWGVGPWRVTSTKADAGAAIGAEGFAAVVRLDGAPPCVAIGAVRPEDVPAVRAAGGVGVAVVSGLLAAADVCEAARRYVEAGPA